MEKQTNKHCSGKRGGREGDIKKGGECTITALILGYVMEWGNVEVKNVMTSDHWDPTKLYLVLPETADTEINGTPQCRMVVSTYPSKTSL